MSDDQQQLKTDDEYPVPDDMPVAPPEGAPVAIPPKHTVLHPPAMHVEHLPDGGARVEMMLSPFEILSVILPPGAKDELARHLSGSGIQVARSLPAMAVPSGRRPGR